MGPGWSDQGSIARNGTASACGQHDQCAVTGFESDRLQAVAHSQCLGHELTVGNDLTVTTIGTESDVNPVRMMPGVPAQRLDQGLGPRRQLHPGLPLTRIRKPIGKFD
jgi:hypothetical protein